MGLKLLLAGLNSALASLVDWRSSGAVQLHRRIRPCDEHDLWQHLYGQCGHDAGADRTLSRATELNDGSLGDWGVGRDVEFSAHSAAQ
jgi:hypothetical protein